MRVSMPHCRLKWEIPDKEGNNIVINWTLRRAEPQDAPALAECVDAAYHPDLPLLRRPDYPGEGNYTRIIALYHVWVAVDRGQIIGGLVLMPKEDHMLLANIAVHPAHQGKGVGKALMELADAEALDQGYKEIRLSANKDMTGTIDMYRRSGWAEMQSGEPGIHRMFMSKLLP
ncbi:GNAT family N-acetyltransferase [Chloroflexota bacterium]